MTPEERQAVVDAEHLWLLSIFHYISGAFTILGSMLAAAWAVFVGVMFSAMPPPPNQDAAEQLGMVPVVMAVTVGAFAGLLMLYGVLEIVAGRCIAKRRSRIFTLIVALPRLGFIPYGTLLTALTFVVLDRSSVQQLYRAGPGDAGGGTSSDTPDYYLPPK
jgi:hypothetical protein